jgi:carboxylesterase
VTDVAPFVLGPARAEKGALLVHGFTGSPFEMRFLGERLAAQGLAVVAPRLAGHEGAPSALARTRWPDWLASVRQALHELRGRAGRVCAVGMSLGGLLSLTLAREEQVQAVATFGTPLWLSPTVTRTATTLDRMLALTKWRPTIPKLGGSDVRDPEMRARNPAVPGFPLAALRSLMELAGRVRENLESIHVPAFVAHGREDHVAPYACGEELARRLPDVRFLDLPRSYHVVSIDVDRELLATELGRFLHERLP